MFIEIIVVGGFDVVLRRYYCKLRNLDLSDKERDFDFAQVIRG